MKLQNKVAVITGGNSGIGLATAHVFGANGARVVIFGRSRRTLDQAAESLGGDALPVQGDVRNLDDLERLFEQTAQRFGKIDVLVANAGIAKFAPVEILSEALFDESVWGFDPDEVMKAQRFVHVSRMGSNPPMKPTRNVPHASRRISTRRYMSYAECSDCNSVGVLKITCDVIAAPHDLSDIKSVAARRKRTLRTGEHDDDTN